MMFCGTCGSKLVKDDRFCRSCGAPATADVTAVESESGGASTATEKPRVGGWAVPLFLFGIIGGFVGWLRLREVDHRRADHVLKWGAIWSAISWIGAPLLTLGVLLAFASALDTSSAPSPVTAAGAATTPAGQHATAAAPSSKQPSVPAGAVAIVGTETIWEADLDTVLKRARKGYVSQKRAFPASGTPDYEQVERSAIDFLIRRSELMQEAQDLHITITADQVDARIAEMQRQLGGEATFEKQMSDNGLIDATLRSDIIMPQLISEALYRHVTAEVKVSDAEIAAYAQSHPGERDRNKIRSSLLRQHKNARMATWVRATTASFAKKIAYAPGYQWARS